MPGKASIALGYTRVSSQEQVAGGFSLEVQARVIQAYCSEHDYKLEESYQDAAISGVKLERPGLVRLRKRLREGGVGAVIVRHLDRLTRDPAQLKVLLDEIHGAGAALVSIVDEIGGKRGLNSREDADMADWVALFASWQWQRGSEATKASQASLRAEGRVDVRARYGFDAIEALDEEGGRRRVWTENEQEMDVLRKIWAWHREGVSNREIAARLNAEGHSGKDGGEWKSQSVANQLSHLKDPEKRDRYRNVLPPGE